MNTAPSHHRFFKRPTSYSCTRFSATWLTTALAMALYAGLCALSVMWLSDWGANGPAFARQYGEQQTRAIALAVAMANDLAKQATKAAGEVAPTSALLAAQKEPDSARAERDQLRQQNKAQQERIESLQTRLAAASPTEPRVAIVSGTPGGIDPARVAAAATASSPTVADRQELSVPNCGAACPTFIVMPNPGGVKIGAGVDAIVANIPYRFAMAKTEVTLGQFKTFWNVTDRNYTPVKTDNTSCNWNDAQYAKDDSHPVRCVNVADAQAYARWFAARYQNQLGVKVQNIGLPSELE